MLQSIQLGAVPRESISRSVTELTTNKRGKGDGGAVSGCFPGMGVVEWGRGGCFVFVGFCCCRFQQSASTHKLFLIFSIYSSSNEITRRFLWCGSCVAPTVMIELRTAFS